MFLIVSSQLVTIDDADYPVVSICNWGLSRDGYVQAWHPLLKRCVLMHRLIMSAAPGVKIDHKNRNPLDNRRCNLRVATTSQNAMNMRSKQNSSSRFKGVMWEKVRSKWVARIKVEGKYLSLGRFDSETAAACAYNDAALRHFGDFALLNDVRV